MASVNPFGKKDELYGFQTLHREIGYYISRLEQYQKSLKFFDEAIKKTPDDRRALIGRSRARAKDTQYEGALQDVNKALGVNPDDLVVLADKAFNTYLCCEFEQGLVQNSRLLPKRQKPENFAEGVMECTDAIENCVGERTGRPLRDHFKIIRKLAWKKNYDAQKPFEPKAKNATTKKKKNTFERLLGQSEQAEEPVQPKLKKSKRVKGDKKDSPELKIRDSLQSSIADNEPIPPLSTPFPFTPLQRYTTNIENYMAEKYLDSMYLDKIFLREIQTQPGANCPNEKGSKKIKQLAKNCFKIVSYKQELLRTRRPFYFIKYQEAKVSGTLQTRQKLELMERQKTIKLEADNILAKMLEAYENKKLKNFLSLVEKLKTYCDAKPKKLLPDKTTYMEEIHDKICKAFYEVYRLNEKQGLFAQNRRIYALLGLQLSKEPSADSVVSQMRGTFLNYKKEIALFEERLENAVEPEEICWYYHELSRYNLETKKYDLSRVYARKCIQSANLINNQRWIFNCIMLMVKSNLQQRNKNDAKNELMEAKKCIQALNDDEKDLFIQKCLETIEGFEFEGAFGTATLEKRENRIVQMMASSHMKDEVAHLFRQMAAMPASRRMTVIPGVRAETSKSGSKPKCGRMSIMPTKKQSDEIFGPKRTGSKKDVAAKAQDIKNIIDFEV